MTYEKFDGYMLIQRLYTANGNSNWGPFVPVKTLQFKTGITVVPTQTTHYCKGNPLQFAYTFIYIYIYIFMFFLFASPQKMGLIFHDPLV